MNIGKNAFYLTERRYRLLNNKNRKINVYAAQWHKLLGKDVLEYLCKTNSSVISFLQDTPFDIDNYSYKITPPQAEHSTIKTETNDTEQPFPAFYTPWINTAEELLKSSHSSPQNNDLPNDFAELLLPKLQGISLRCLIMEMHQCKQNNRLKGKTTAEEYQYFNNEILSTREFTDYLYGKYPVMARELQDTVESEVRFWTEVLNHWQQEKGMIRARMKKAPEFEEIVKIEGNLADTHNNGRCVLQLSLRDGSKLFYKPRSTENEQIYQELLQWLYSSVGLDIYDYERIDMGSHSWVEQVPYRSCASMEELKRYYQRIGIQLFLCYLLNIKDLHCENIIACGEYPVFIDLETGVGMRAGRGQLKTANEKCRLILQESVLYLGILPIMIWNAAGNGINVGAIGGRENQQVPMKIPHIAEAGTSDMHVEYRYPRTKSYKNQALLNGQYIDAGQFLGDIIKGFTKAYEIALRNKQELSKRIGPGSGGKSRYVVRQTQRYTMLLQSSYHPDVMTDGGNRNMLFYNLYQETQMRSGRMHPVVENEVKSLLKGDVPYFYYRNSERSLFSSDGNEFPEFFEQTAMDGLMQKIVELDNSDLKRQIQYITFAVLSLDNQVFLNSYGKEALISHKASVLDETMILRAAGHIGKRLADTAVFHQNHSEAGWISLMPDQRGKNGWELQSVDRYLYNGLAGINLFIHALLTVMPEESVPAKERNFPEAFLKTDSELRSLAEILDQMFFAYTQSAEQDVNSTDTPNTGAFFGEGSIAYMYQVLYQITGQEIYLQYAKRHCDILPRFFGQDQSFDLLSGNAGAVLVLTDMFRLTKEEKYLADAVTAADLLLTQAEATDQGIGWCSAQLKQPIGGMAHGNSGFLLAFARLFRYTARRDYLEAVGKILRYENSLYDEATNNWKDIREEAVLSEEMNAQVTESVAWCHGAAGVLLGRVNAAAYISDGDIQSILQRDITRGLEKLKQTPRRRGYCLCHGNTGNIGILMDYARKNKDQDILMECTCYVNELASGIYDGSLELMLQEDQNVGLMTGLAGIGYVMLRALHPELPDIMAVEI